MFKVERNYPTTDNWQPNGLKSNYQLLIINYQFFIPAPDEAESPAWLKLFFYGMQSDQKEALAAAAKKTF